MPPLLVLSLTPSSTLAAIASIIGEEGKAPHYETYDLPYLLHYSLRTKVKSNLVVVIEGLPVVGDSGDQTMPTDIDDVIFLTLDFLIAIAIRGQQKMRKLFEAIDEDKSGTISWTGNKASL